MRAAGPADGPISIHAPRGRGDVDKMVSAKIKFEFQSTPLAGGATAAIELGYNDSFEFQSTPLAGGATLPSDIEVSSEAISIHAPRGRGDLFRCIACIYGG